MAQSYRRVRNVDPSHLPLLESVQADVVSMLGERAFRSFTDGDVIFREGDPGNSMFVVLYGQVDITRHGTHLVFRRANEVIGEQTCIERTIRSSTATAVGAVQLLEISQLVFDRLLDDPQFCRNLLTALSGKLREATSEREVRYAREQALFSGFRSHVSPEVLDELLYKGHDEYGQPRFIDATILFSDIRNFSSRSASMEPAAIASELGSYLDAVVDVIHDHGGFVDKFIGDAVMAMWGFYSTGDDLALQAYRCAESMVRTARKCTFGSVPIEIGVGLNAGRVFMGNVGSESKRQFTVLGTPVNLAARLEGKAREFGSSIVVGAELFRRLPADIASQLRRHENVELKGVGKMTCYSGDAFTETA